MPAESEKQRRFMALVNAAQSGKVSKSKVSGKVKKAAKSMTKEQSHDFMQKKAAGSDFFSGGRKPVDPSDYSVTNIRRPAYPEELALFETESKKWFPDFFDGPGEPLAQDMASPLKGALLYGTLAGLGGKIAGKKLGELIQTAKLDDKIDPKKLERYGGVTTAALAAMLVYFKRWQKNKTIEDETLRLPRGATKRDRDWNPAINMEEDPDDYIKRVGALNSAMMGRRSPKEEFFD